MTTPRPGDTFHLDLGGTAITGRYIEVDGPHRLVMEWDRHGTDNETPTPVLIEVTLTPTGDSTTVKVQCARAVGAPPAPLSHALTIVTSD